MMKFIFSMILPLLSLCSPLFGSIQSSWVLDQTHSSVKFFANHMMISEISGEFKDFFASVYYDENDVSNSTINFSIDVNSIDTGNERRDNHLKSKDFLDVKKHRTITFKSLSIEHVRGNEYSLLGKMVIKDVTKPFKVTLIRSEAVKDHWGSKRIALKLSGNLNRFDFNLNWNELLEAGGLIVGEEIRIACVLQLFQQPNYPDIAL